MTNTGARIFRPEAGIFIIFLLFVLLLSLVAFKVSDLLHQDFEQTQDIETTKERLLNEQIRVLSERRILIRDIALADDPFERDDLIQEHARNAATFLETRNQLLALQLSPVEQKIFDEQIDLNRKGYQAQLNLINALIDEEIERPGEVILNDIQPLLRGINQRLIEQRGLIIKSSDKARQSAQDRYESGWTWILTLYITTLVFTGILALWIYYRQKSHQSALHHQAIHDALTGLTNRMEFERQLEEALEESRYSEVKNVVLYLDLDQFKIVNDTCGHVAGDELLKDISLQMRDCIRGVDLLSRLGGDEFGVLLRGCGEGKGREIAEAIRHTVSDYHFMWSGREFHVGVSIGMAVLSEYYVDISEVMSAVDVACYIAKDHGRNQVHVYTDDDADSTARHGELHHASQIKRAVSQNHFRLYYQEIQPVDSSRNHRKVEILLRMQYEGELVMPDYFIPAAERFNLMPMIDRWVVRQVLDMINTGEDECLQGIDTICINLSGASIADPSFIKDVFDAIDHCDLGDKHICFEITESAAISKLSRAVSFINRMRERGITFALDDFGKGLSSYNYLKQLPIDYLKIDGSFVSEMAPGSPDYVFVQSINTVGKALGLQTIAEWVESEDVYRQLGELGVDYVQGKYIGDIVACTCNPAELTIPNA